MNILVLGAGRMGYGAAYDLVNNSDVGHVTIADVDRARVAEVAKRISSAPMKKSVTGISFNSIAEAQVDVGDRKRVVDLMRGHDAAISCVTYHHNLSLAEAAIEARTNFCDLGGNNDVVARELALDPATRDAGINIVPDCGLAPGMVSVLVAHGATRFKDLGSVRIRVGGLPQTPRPPLNYQIVFSIEGLINEYVERARVVRAGEITEVESLTEVERLSFSEPFGELEAFQTSGGTSTLPETFKDRVRELDYKTIRYPGHCEQFKLLVDLGLTSGEEVEIDGQRISPRRVLGEMLVQNLPADEPDAVLVRVEFEGETREGARGTLRYDIIDLFDARTGLSAMMRTTAFPASIIAQMMARGEMPNKGAIPQERCVPPERFVAELAARDIRINESWIER